MYVIVLRLSWTLFFLSHSVWCTILHISNQDSRLMEPQPESDTWKSLNSAVRVKPIHQTRALVNVIIHFFLFFDLKCIVQQQDSKNIEIENIGRKCPGILNPIDLKKTYEALTSNVWMDMTCTVFLIFKLPNPRLLCQKHGTYDHSVATKVTIPKTRSS